MPRFVLVAWLAFLFSSIALIVDIRLVPNLASISEFFKLSDVVAGVCSANGAGFATP